MWNREATCLFIVTVLDQCRDSLSSFSFSFVMPECLLDLIRQWSGGVKGMQGRIFMRTVLQGILWGIWKKQNIIIF